MKTIIYHADCYDGFCAAWLCHTVWPDAKFIPAKYGDSPPNVQGDDVLIVDFSYPRAVLLAMKASAKSIVVLDHHKTAQADLVGLDWCHFDMERSGGRLTWDYLWNAISGFYRHANREERPWLVDYTEDRDLWHHKLTGTKEINAALRLYPMKFKEWDLLAKTDLHQLIVEGTTVLKYQQRLIDNYVSHAHPFTIDEYDILAVNCSCSDVISEVAGTLAIGKPFGVAYFYTKDKKIVSLRSSPDGIDVAEIAKRFGGGGHKHAAGFSELLWK